MHSKVFARPSRGAYTLMLSLTRQAGEGHKEVQRSHFFIVDLPGYEHGARPRATPEYSAEAKDINQTLTVLTECLLSHKSHRPYRDSLLTVLLHPMFSRHYVEHAHEINVLALISSRTEDLEDTLGTLALAQSVAKAPAALEQSREDFTSLRSNLEEKDRLLSDKDAKLLLQQSENDELRRENESLRAVIAQYKDKHARLRAQLKELSSTVRKSSADKEEWSRTAKSEAERRFKEELDAIQRRKEAEMTEFRMKISSESSQSFANQVQRMTAEHDSTVAKLMETIVDKQRQEQKLIALVNKEQEECRRLRMEMAMRTVQSPKQGLRQDSDISIPALALPLDSERDSAVLQGTSLKEETLGLDEEKKFEDLVSDGESLDELKPEQSKRTHTRSISSPLPPAANGQRAARRSPSLSQSGSEDQPEPSSRPLPTSPREEEYVSRRSIPASVSVQPSLLPVLTFVFLRMQSKLKVTKLNRAGKEKAREIWVERLEPFLGTGEGPKLWTQALSYALIRWSTTSRFKRATNLCFRLSEVVETSADQQSPGFQKNPSTGARAHLSLWACYRHTTYFEVIFDDRQSLVVWSAGLKLGRLAVNSPSPDFQLWRQEYEHLVADCGMAEA